MLNYSFTNKRKTRTPDKSVCVFTELNNFLTLRLLLSERVPLRLLRKH
jgi:hypothetical protein